MGLYDEAGKLNYIGRCGVGDNGQEITKFLKPFIGGSGVTGSTPGGLSRWSGRERKPIPLEPRLVAGSAQITSRTAASVMDRG